MNDDNEVQGEISEVGPTGDPTGDEFEIKETTSKNMIHNTRGTRMSSNLLELLLKDISTAFHSDICKVSY